LPALNVGMTRLRAVVKTKAAADRPHAPDVP
jgi:hypothetical protein